MPRDAGWGGGGVCMLLGVHTPHLVLQSLCAGGSRHERLSTPVARPQRIALLSSGAPSGIASVLRRVTLPTLAVDTSHTGGDPAPHWQSTLPTPAVDTSRSGRHVPRWRGACSSRCGVWTPAVTLPNASGTTLRCAWSLWRKLKPANVWPRVWRRGLKRHCVASKSQVCPGARKSALEPTRLRGICWACTEAAW
eukprot:361093-Chlamydomonas_euryale.AAC.4